MPPPPAPRTAAAGFGLLELLITVTVISFMVGVVVNLVVTSTESQNYNERLSRATVVNQDLLDGMRFELASSVALFQNDSVGNSYLSMMATSPGPAALASSTLSTIDPVGIFDREASSGASTGNSLLFARHAWTTEFTTTSTTTYRIDLYRFMYYYLATEQAGPQPGSSTGLNLCKFVGEPMADGDQIDRITDPTDLGEILQHLATATADDSGTIHAPVAIVWRRKVVPSIAGTLRQIDTSTYSLSDTPLSPRAPTWEILRDAERSSDGLLYYRHFSVVSNYARASWGIGTFGIIDNSGDGFPHGFELQIVGPSAGRLVLLHLTIASTTGTKQTAHSDMRTQVFVADV